MLFYTVTSETGSVLAPNTLVCFAVLFVFAGRLTGEDMLTDSVAFQDFLLSSFLYCPDPKLLGAEWESLTRRDLLQT